MFKSTSLLFLALSTLALARKCKDFSVTVPLTARNAVFNLDTPLTEIDATNFFLRLATQGKNLTDELLTGYNTVHGTYQLAATYCEPDSGPGHTLQILTHGVGFDRSYWDIPYNNYNYSYVARAVDQHGYSTLSWDRLGIGASSKGEPVNEIQVFLEIEALRELTTRAAQGKLSCLPKSFKKIVHAGHSFGSVITYNLANIYSNLTQGIALTGFTQVPNYIADFALGGNFVPVTENPFLKFKYPPGYLTPASSVGVHINFFAPGDFDPKLLDYTFRTGQPATPGELLTVGSGAGAPNSFTGPVLIITGDKDIPFCGGNCLGTSAIGGSVPNLLEVSASFFKQASVFNATIVPGAGHGLNTGYSHPITYNTILDFFNKNV